MTQYLTLVITSLALKCPVSMTKYMGDAMLNMKTDVLHRSSGPQGQILPLTIVEDPSAWTVASVREADDWIYSLSPSDISEIDSALKLVATLNVRKEVSLSSRFKNGIHLQFLCVVLYPDSLSMKFGNESAIRSGTHVRGVCRIIVI